ncbi:hypothetical protein M404DRAFT_1001963 [Pisolithus tinctorius Marx 270]|uniref:Uncharacterized protein n=1 Tax=Pisolithus tinctorius Marx 270 TaxID=870435 RepID=A0A0C3JZC2_PISTI|nr:hypothetical protein M404DRAFT_1001963 [Pisolithus tinctorius Marx 270]
MQSAHRACPLSARIRNWNQKEKKSGFSHDETEQEKVPNTGYAENIKREALKKIGNVALEQQKNYILT